MVTLAMIAVMCLLAIVKKVTVLWAEARTTASLNSGPL